MGSSPTHVKRCQLIIHEVCSDFEAELPKLNGKPDPVHLLVPYPPRVQLSKLVNSLIDVNARLLCKEFAPHLPRYLRGGHL
jgi:putative transposase